LYCPSKNVPFVLQIRDRSAEPAGGQFNDLRCPGQYAESLFDRINRLKTVEHRRRNISGGERGKTRRPDIKNLVFLRAQSFAPHKLGQDDVHSGLSRITSNYLTSKLLHAGNLFGGNERMVGTIQPYHNDSHRHSPERRSCHGTCGCVKIQIAGQ
jgi:hypothetical protein